MPPCNFGKLNRSQLKTVEDLQRVCEEKVVGKVVRYDISTPYPIYDERHTRAKPQEEAALPLTGPIARRYPRRTRAPFGDRFRRHLPQAARTGLAWLVGYQVEDCGDAL